MKTIENDLCKLVALGLGNDATMSNQDVDWKKLYTLSIKHVVAAICIDGMSATGLEHSCLQNIPKQIKLQWVSSVMQTEKIYNRQRDIIERLAEIYNEEGLQILLLKGYGLSMNYPNPRHRICGDIDIYMFGDGGKADRLIEKKFGIKSKQNEDKHSTFPFEGIMVENHASIINTAIHPNTLSLEYYFEEEAKKAESIDIGKITCYVPTVNMNALFLSYHIAGHFCHDETNLRQLCDWATFVMHEGKNVDWNMVKLKAKETGFFKFLCCINGIVIDKLGVPRDCLPKWERNHQLEERVLSNILNYGNKIPNTVVEKIKRFWKNRWKYKLVYNENIYLHFILLAKSYYRTKINKNARSIWDK